MAYVRGPGRDHRLAGRAHWLSPTTPATAAPGTFSAERDLGPLAARRSHLELYIRWIQEIRFEAPLTAGWSQPGSPERAEPWGRRPCPVMG